jgi:hypothetical protein
MGFQKAKRVHKAIYDHTDSESSNNEHLMMLYVMFRGSWDITSCRIIKNLCREVVAAAPAPKAAPHLVLKMTSPNDILKIRRDYDAGISALEKLQALSAQHQAAAGPGSPDLAPLSSR